jgi:hypothetical protein
MQGKTKKVIQLALLLAFIAAAVRLYLVYSERHDESQMKVTTGRPEVDTGLSADAYVVPKRLHAYDLQSAKALIGKPAWVKEGYRYTVYPVAGGHADFNQDGTTLGPIERIEIKDVRLQASPSGQGQQVLAVFDRQGKPYALPIGTAHGKDFQIYADEALFIEDPHQLYKHWPAEVWQAIEQHQIKPGMNEMQASFAIGMGTPAQTDDSSARVVVYPNGGKQITVTYRGGKAARIDAS